MSNETVPDDSGQATTRPGPRVLGKNARCPSWCQAHSETNRPGTVLHRGILNTTASRVSNEYAGETGLATTITAWDVREGGRTLRYPARIEVLGDVDTGHGCWDTPNRIEGYAQQLILAADELRSEHARHQLRPATESVEALSAIADITNNGESAVVGLDEWVTWMQAKGLAVRTITERVRFMDRVQREISGDIDTVTTDHLAQWFAAQTELSPGSRETYFAVLRSWFTWLVLNERRADDPTLRLGKPKAPRRRPRPVSTAHVEAVLQSGIRRRTRAMILLGAFQGLRAHEIAKIRGQDIDLVDGTLRVNGKGGVREWLPLHSEIAKLADQFPRTGYWFTSYTIEGRPIDAKSVSATISQAMRRAGIDATAHQLRHWHATELVRSGTDLRTTQTLMRHASLATTALYTAVDVDRQEEALSRLPVLEP